MISRTYGNLTTSLCFGCVTSWNVPASNGTVLLSCLNRPEFFPKYSSELHAVMATISADLIIVLSNVTQAGAPQLSAKFPGQACSSKKL